MIIERQITLVTVNEFCQIELPILKFQEKSFSFCIKRNECTLRHILVFF